MLPTTDGSLGCARCSNISAMYVLSSSGGNPERDGLSNNFTDLSMYVLSSIDGSLGSDKLSNISTDFGMYALSSSGGNLGRDVFSNNSTDLMCMRSLASMEVLEVADLSSFS